MARCFLLRSTPPTKHWKIFHQWREKETSKAFMRFLLLTFLIDMKHPSGRSVKQPSARTLTTPRGEGNKKTTRKSMDFFLQWFTLFNRRNPPCWYMIFQICDVYSWIWMKSGEAPHFFVTLLATGFFLNRCWIGRIMHQSNPPQNQTYPGYPLTNSGWKTILSFWNGHFAGDIL